jgi:formate C-acetyltransferase
MDKVFGKEVQALKSAMLLRVEPPGTIGFRIGNYDTGLIQLGYNDARAAGDSDVIAWAKGFCTFFEEAELELHPNEILGCFFNNQRKGPVMGIRKPDGAITGHFSVDYALMLKLGIKNGLKYIEEWRGKVLSDTNPNKDPRSADFFTACALVWRGFGQFLKRYQEIAEKRLTDPNLSINDRKWVTKIAQTMVKLQDSPPADLYEAITLVSNYHMVIQNAVGCCSFGQPDQFLYPYYLQSLKDGASTSDIKDLLAVWFIKISEFMNIPQGFMIGGQNSQGECMANDLTLLMLQVAGEINLVNPAMSFAWNPKIPKQFMDQIMLNFSRGVMHPQIFNDLTIIPGLERIGVAHEDAVHYVNCTCTEPTTTGCSNIFVVTEYVNPNRCMLKVIHGGNFQGLHNALNSKTFLSYEYNPALVPEFESFDEFIEAFFEELAVDIDRIARDQIRHQKTRINTFAQPIISLFMHDCIEKGLDLAWGGGRYNYSYLQLVGFSSLIDSLYAIKELVFTSHSYTLSQIGNILAQNWQGFEEIRQFIVNKIPKWGNDRDEIDALGKQISDKYAQLVEQYTGIFPNSSFHPGYLNWVMHGEYGRELGATPDGRLQKMALSNSFAPAQGVGRDGLTAICNSAVKIDQKRAIGSSTLNLTLLKSALDTPDQREKFSQFLQTYLTQGGTQVQVNIFDQAMLRDAQQHPEKYSNLVVKVGGFSARFVDLNSVIQNEIIARNGFTL